MTIDPVTSSVVASSSCLIELLLTILWAAFSFPRGKEVFYASPIICSSFQNREEPGSLWKTLLFFFWLSMKWQWFWNHSIDIVENFVTISRQLLCLRRCETISLSLNTSIRWIIRMRDFIQICDFTLNIYLLSLNSHHLKTQILKGHYFYFCQFYRWTEIMLHHLHTYCVYSDDQMTTVSWPS